MAREEEEEEGAGGRKTMVGERKAWEMRERSRLGRRKSIRKVREGKMGLW